MKSSFPQKTNGFTLVELIIVIAIIGILATVGVMQYTKYLKSARDSQRTTVTNEIAKVAILESSKESTFPTADFTEDRGIGKVLAAVDFFVPKDPSDNEANGYCYVYVTTTDQKQFAVVAKKENTDLPAGVTSATGSLGFFVSGTPELETDLQDVQSGVQGLDCKKNVNALRVGSTRTDLQAVYLGE